MNSARTTSNENDSDIFPKPISPAFLPTHLNKTHLRAPANVVDELCVHPRVRRLHLARVTVEEDRAEETHLFDCIRLGRDADAVADVVRVLDEQEDYAREHLREAATNEPAETYGR